MDETPGYEEVDGEADGPDREIGHDPAYLEKLLPWMETFASYFDPEVRGFENIPDDDAGLLLVGNHSGGLMVPDTSVFITAWYREFGLERPLAGLAHDVMFSFEWIGDFMRSLGEIPANHANAESALRAGSALMVYPGGAYDAFRSWRDRNRITFEGHKGFVRLAIRSRVKVVPVVGQGGHDSLIVLARGEGVARKLGLSKLGMQVAPLLWQIPWGISLPLLPGIPLPAKITMQILEPLDWTHYPPEAADDEEILRSCYDEIVERMQTTLDQLAEENPRPVARRLWDLLPSSLRRRDSGEARQI
jgi:1-acyl-sn-glycerol-3-phosphate acyltransferase